MATEEFLHSENSTGRLTCQECKDGDPGNRVHILLSPHSKVGVNEQIKKKTALLMKDGFP